MSNLVNFIIIRGISLQTPLVKNPLKQDPPNKTSQGQKHIGQNTQISKLDNI